MAHVLVFCVSVHACGGMVLSEQLHQDEDEGSGVKGSRSVPWWGRGRPGQAGVVCRWMALAEWGKDLAGPYLKWRRYVWQGMSPCVLHGSRLIWACVPALTTAKHEDAAPARPQAWPDCRDSYTCLSFKQRVAPLAAVIHQMRAGSQEQLRLETSCGRSIWMPGVSCSTAWAAAGV